MQPTLRFTNALILLISEPNGFHFEDVRTGTLVDEADAIRAGFTVPPQDSIAALRMIRAGLAAKPATNMHATAWERIQQEGLN